MDYRNFEVIVVDNASSDKSVSIIKKLYPQIIMIENKDNIGFTGGNNIAMKYAMDHGADYVWLLNNDTTVEKESLSALIDYAERKKPIGLISSQVYYHCDPNLPQFVGSYINWESLEIEYPNQNDAIINPIYQEGNHVCLWGTALLVSRAIIEKIGYLNERFFAYWEDTEYSIRAILAGYNNAICPCSRIYHNTDPPQVKVKSPHFYFYMLRNEYLLKNGILKGLQRINFKRRYYSNVLSLLSYFIKYQNGHKESINGIIEGIWNGIKGRGGTMMTAEKSPPLFKKLLIVLAAYPPYFWSYFLQGEYKLMLKKGVERLKKLIEKID